MSPGQLPGEDKFIKAITEPGANYLLPEYVTGILLSRNVEIVFRGISASQSSHALHVATRAKFNLKGSRGFGFWRARGKISGKYSSSNSTRTFSAESTSDGLRITIPGAQIIGYYTKVLPQFPSP